MRAFRHVCLAALLLGHVGCTNIDDFDTPLVESFLGALAVTPAVDGIYAAGCVKHPCDVSRCTKDATGSALKAIQCIK